MRRLAILSMLMVHAPLVASAQSSTDYTVFSVVLEGAFDEGIGQSADKSSRFVVRDSTEAKGLATAGLRTEFMRRQFGFFSSAYQGTLDDFIARNQSAVKLSAKPFSTKGNVDVVTRKDLPPSSDPEKYWEDFFARFPHARGLIAFSRPGFDAERKYALVYFHVACGSLCGQRGYALLRFIGGRWIVVRRVVTMMS